MKSKELFDWRLHVAIPGKRKAGGLFQKEDDVIIKGILPPFIFNKIKISFGLPNACALYIGNAYKLYKQALDIRCQALNKIKFDRIPDNLAFAYFEKMMGSVLFAYSSIEAFANYEIPDDHYHYKQKKILFLAESKKTVERWEPLEIKLCDILPEVLKIKSPKGEKEWQDYKGLKDIRDRIVHLKTIDQQAKHGEPNTIWEILFKPDVPNCPNIAKNLISYFYKNNEEKKPRWFKNIPIEFK